MSVSRGVFFFFDGIQATCSTLLPPFVPQTFSSVSPQQGMKLHYKGIRPHCRRTPPPPSNKEQPQNWEQTEAPAVQHHRNIHATPHRYEFATQIYMNRKLL